MQYKNKKKLYKIIFIVILLGFIISLVGCDWFSLGLLNIFDPQAQIEVSYTEIDLTEGVITLEIYSINEVEFIGSGFEYKYYIGTTEITELSKTVGATFYVAPSTTPGTPGPITIIENLPLYFQEVQDYSTSHPLITEIICTIDLIGTDGAGHNITISISFDLPVLQPGIDFEPPTAVIEVTPDTTGTVPFTVVFDASGSTDVGSGIASYSWDFGDGTSATGVTPTAHTYTSAGTYIVKLTVTDYYGNAGVDTATIIVNSYTASTITLQAAPTTVTAVTGSSTITATVKDAAGSPVADGTAVTFSTTFGTLSSSYETTVNGIVTTELTFSAGDSSSTVTATSGSVSATVVVTYSVTPGVPSAIILQAAPATVATDSDISIITAIITDASGNLVADGTVVTFTTTLGTLSPTSATTVNGIATTVLTYTGAGTVTVTATSGAISRTVQVIFQP